MEDKIYYIIGSLKTMIDEASNKGNVTVPVESLENLLEVAYEIDEEIDNIHDLLERL